MYSSSLIAVTTTALLSLVRAQSATEPITGKNGNATVVTNNPIGKVYTATLPEKPFFRPTNPDGNVKGSISAVANSDGVGVEFTVNFENLPSTGGPFHYHIHDAPVPADGNCTKTLAHADPFIRGETPPCDSQLPETCQTGDLSGKYGDIIADPFQATYSDDFASTLPGIGAFFGNRSFVIHFANKTRITCANFTLVSNDTTPVSAPYPSQSPVPSSLPAPKPSSTLSGPPTPFTGAAGAAAAPLLAVTAVFGLFFML